MTNEPVHQWLLADIGTLRETSFRTETALASSSFTLTVWYTIQRTGRRQVIVRLNPTGETGWTLAVEDSHLVAEYGTAERAIIRIEGPKVTPERWSFAAVSADSASASLSLMDGRQTVSSARGLPDSDFILSEVIIGGYTDPAGGHYDHTFGRDGGGLADDVQLYDRVLTEDELAVLAAVTGEAPVARLIWAAERQEAPCDVHFQAADANNAHSFVWDFGDGTGVVGRAVTHHYAHAGEFPVRLIAIGSGHQQATVEEVLSLTGRPELISAPVFVNGSEGYACYRIPSIVRAANGDLLAFAEGRRDSCSDSTPVIHIVSKRSADNGRTWEPLQVAAQHGEQALMNASPAVDTARGSGRIVLLYNLMTANEWALARGEGRNQTLCITSGDHGVSWSAPHDVSEQIGERDWRIQRPTLGHAVQRPDGRIIHVSTITAGDAGVFASQNALIWSDDLGESWHHAQPCPVIGLNEAAAVVLSDGSVLINSRAYINEQPAGRRALTRAHFTAESGVHYGVTIYHPVLEDSAVQASMLRLETERGSVILFAHPAHSRARRRLTLHLTFDDGATWPVAREIDGGPAAYSDLALQEDGRLAILYERGNHGGIFYVSLAPDELIDSMPRSV
ncbi:MAG: exo-alpha-sialidase [Anaerolineae bacterium]|nr:exo-alpha-sialidase [Anaerolineae bacterium]